MKLSRISMLAAIVAVVTLSSCQQVKEPSSTSGEVNKITFTAEDFTCDGSPLTRVDFSITSSGAKFKWSADDTVGIYPESGCQVYFGMTQGAGTSSAVFDGGGWQLRSDCTYRSYYPFIADYYLDPASIPVDYRGQVQTGNGSTSHIGDYDFMAASGTTSTSGALAFRYTSLEALIQFKLSTDSGAYESLKMEASDEIFTLSGTYDLTSDSFSITPDTKSKSVSLSLKNTIINEGDSMLVCYMMVAPADASKDTVKITLTDTLGIERLFYIPGRNFKAGKAYQLCNGDFSYVPFEDDVFKAYVVKDYDTDGDGEITVAEAALIDTIDVSSDDIYKVSGIEYMPNLVCLKVRGSAKGSGSISSIDVSCNPLLETFYCDNNSIKEIDLSSNTRIKTLYCGSNSIESINFGDITSLTYIGCTGNEIDTLALGRFTDLKSLYCGNNNLTSIDVTNLSNLVNFNCSNNDLGPVIDISNNMSLNLFNCSGNDNLTEIWVWTGFDKASSSSFVKPSTASYVVHSNITDLSAEGTANCYIAAVNRYKYSFDASVKGNSKVSVGDVSSASVIWESNSQSGIAVGDVIGDVAYVSSLKTVTFKAKGEGNAVIAVMDAGGKILWSWHIWVTSYNPLTSFCTYTGQSVKMMDRDLGALSNTAGDSLAIGLMYQWGRKDPFPGAMMIDSSLVRPSTSVFYTVKSNGSTGKMEYAVKNPTTFITYSDNQETEDWMYSSCDTLWGAAKTMYDPCPVGWKVPNGGSDGIWGKMKYWMTSDSENCGVILSSAGSTPATWFPYSGLYNGYDGKLSSVGAATYLWSSTVIGDQSFIIYPQTTFSTSAMNRSAGISVRCCAE